MLSVSLSLAAVIATLVGVIWPGSPEELDSLNSPTAWPFPRGLR